ncbi:hypothetical protein EG19_07070 [Thermoanaerobaculum aquaticum]|jgi:hypothetical protein|uniref:Uncharacterized protein n=1 Tax=Thermoanaerobaculum aquaticum TaxID=1312852 RepID=A0A062XXK7_9BACT|nr:hypothetical protein [Thermoanaerobaculum aquaticum]KDA53240.1 hypothetical protein EG19_07070 [Thermoanaerobaculum aquaticum]
MNFKRLSFKVFLMAVLPLLFGKGVSWALSIQISGHTVEVSGLKPGAEVAIIGCSYSQEGLFPRVRAIEAHVQADGASGVARLSLPEELPVMTVVGAVDLLTGEVGVGAHPDYPYTLWKGPADQPLPTSPGRAGIVIPRVRQGRVLWVRPGVAGFVASIVGSDREVPLNRFRGISRQEPVPSVLQRGDVILGFDQERLEFWVFTVGR